MKKFCLLLVVSVVTLAICPTHVFAKSSSSSSSSSSKKKKPVVHHDTLISSVSGDSITITEDKATKTFKISSMTEIDVRGQKATAADLKPGMMVSITIGMDQGTAERISAGDAPVHPDASSAKKKK